MTLRDFLGARYTEDETFFRAAAGDEDHQDWAFNQAGDLNEGALVWAALRILNEIAANRRLVALHTTPLDDIVEALEEAEPGWEYLTDDAQRLTRADYLHNQGVLRALAGVYAEHEDFRPDWAS